MVVCGSCKEKQWCNEACRAADLEHTTGNECDVFSTMKTEHDRLGELSFQAAETDRVRWDRPVILASASASLLLPPPCTFSASCAFVSLRPAAARSSDAAVSSLPRRDPGYAPLCPNHPHPPSTYTTDLMCGGCFQGYLTVSGDMKPIDDTCVLCRIGLGAKNPQMIFETGFRLWVESGGAKLKPVQDRIPSENEAPLQLPPAKQPTADKAVTLLQYASEHGNTSAAGLIGTIFFW